MLPLLWLTGPSGVGKSTVGWTLQQRLTRSGTPAAFIDADQLRNAAGVEAGEDDFIADGLLALEPRFRAAGARLLIVAGIMDDEAHFARLLPGATRGHVRVVHLGAADDTLIERIEKRRWNVELAPESVAYAHGFDTSWVDLSLDTTRLPAHRIADALVGLAEDLIDSPGAQRPLVPESDAAATVTLVSGAGGVGASTTGFLAFLKSAWAGESAGYIDSHQLGFFGDDPHAATAVALRAENTAALVRVMADRGIAQVIVSGDATTAHGLARALPGARTMWLHASPDAIAARIRARAAGGGPPLAGDRRLGLSGAELAASIAESVREAADPGFRPAGSVVIDTDGCSAEQVAGQIIAAR
ncbi:gluconate kinase [Microbacterium sp. ZKA21]|uniref:AAA family ATPase n=1 Tax=Microbacterium sp. ZKA21 TaxID=3381694 RepID=UPI003D19C284